MAEQTITQIYWGDGTPQPEPKTMLDRAARAVEDIAWRDGEREPLNAHDDAREIARAVLAGMRIDDPLSAILAAGRCTTGHWNRMIEAALAEEMK